MRGAKPSRWNYDPAWVGHEWRSYWDALTHAYLIDDKGGAGLRNAAPGHALPGVLSDLTNWTVGPDGGRLDLRTSPDHVDLNGNFGLGASGNPFTILTVFKTGGNISGDRQIWGRNDATYLFQLGLNVGTEIRCAYGDFGATIHDVRMTSEFTLKTNTEYLVALTFGTDNTMRMWAAPRGEELYLTDTETGFDAFVDSTEIHIGRRGGDEVEHSGVSLDGLLVWNRELREPELQRLAADPFGMFR